MTSQFFSIADDQAQEFQPQSGARRFSHVGPAPTGLTAEVTTASPAIGCYPTDITSLSTPTPLDGPWDTPTSSAIFCSGGSGSYEEQGSAAAETETWYMTSEIWATRTGSDFHAK